MPASLIGNIPDAPTVTYNYMTADDKMRLSSYTVTGNMGNETFGYDSYKRLSQATQTFTNRESYPLVTNYNWDSLGRMQKLTYPLRHSVGDTLRKEMTPTYDMASRLNGLTFDGASFASNPVYNAASQVESLNVGSLKQETYTYDTKTGLLLDQKVKQGTTTNLWLGYNYTTTNDPNNNGPKTGQLTGVIDYVSFSRGKAYKYDSLGRLKEARGGADPFNNPNWTQTYSYDRYGNRTGVAKSGPGAGSVPLDGLASLGFNTASNRVSGYDYDPAGNLTRGQTDDGVWLRYKYDAAGRLAQVMNDSGVAQETYSYGASNKRLKTVYGNGLGAPATYYGWDGGQVITEYRDGFSSNLVWEKHYVYLGGRLLATTDSSGTKYHHPDRLGTRLITDGATGTALTEQANLPFGAALTGESSGTISNRRFTSYDRSATTGMDYAVNRFYSAAQGRFTQVDPIGMGAASLSDPQSLNLYSYCGNDPVNYVDPGGLFFKKLFGWIGKALKAIAKIVIMVVAGMFLQSLPAPRICPHCPPAPTNRPGTGRTPPFISNFSDDLENIGLVEKIITWEPGPWWDNVLVLARRDQGSQEVLEMGFPIGAIARMLVRYLRTALKARKAAGGAGAVSSASRSINFTIRQLQAKFKHAPDFGVVGNSNSANLARFQSAIEAHVNNPATRVIQGTYRGQPVTHFVDPHTGLNVITGRSGDFVSGWRLSSGQLTNVLTRGSL